MSLSKKKIAPTYQQRIFGTYGQFSTPGGCVRFLNTKAKLGKSNISLEHRLTSFLSPVREVLPHKDMNFNQLLQRDLDDHRVAVELVPYLFDTQNNNPAFFPPIVAALLPFEGQDPIDHFPELSEGEDDDDLASWSYQSYGDAFKFDRLMDGEGEEHILKSGRLSWNPEKAKLVVIDGQHRAMALLAVDRTINSKWSGAAEKYRSFYEPTVNKLLKTAGPGFSNFENVEFPVSLIWFPELEGSHQKAARKIFVDLNKNARKPSDSRILLLSDDDLIGVFTRTTLNVFRDEEAGFPIYAVEYDNPESDQSTASKWSVITNVSLLSACIKRMLCGPAKHFKDLSSKFGGKESSTELAHILRESLDVSSVLEEVITEDRIYKRGEISHLEFPPSKLPLLEQQYLRGWGHAIKEIYTNLLPFQKHAAALEELKESWITADSAATLAKDSIFEGVGIYWTLKDSESYWREINNERRARGESATPKTDVIDAWSITQAKRVDFLQRRARHYLNQKKLEDYSASEAAYQVYSTAACQLGIILALRAVSTKANIKFEQIADFSRDFVETVNAFLANKPLCLAKDVPEGKKRFNLLGKMDTPYATYFRYFWLEVLAKSDLVGLIERYISKTDLDEMVSQGRESYRAYLLDEMAKDLKRSRPEYSEAQLRAEATQIIDRQLTEGLRSWFEVKKADYEQWVQSLSANLKKSADLDFESSEEVEEQVDKPVEAADEFIENLFRN
ncbi:DNA sulfur modification protein DndB [Pseudomonas luteola]|uniref:DNA sulfur modification protein DndB n=1 Tax=Pseudomonas luteola TaxID=47886 RepID=UPI00123A2175|nr:MULTISPECIES: DNA sulfur modification protein DndB [Pseudomonas]MBA1249939.1 hypothetical protein [Pseudomonas zeshuii]QEU28766.1 hypothetical protein FOB45_13635 [Pseudomonas luteola]